MIISTTTSIEGRPVRDYVGIVTGEAILGANIFKDLFAGIRDIVGGRSGAYEEELRKARTIALEELAAAASQMGADAVIGVDLDYETVGQGGSMLMVTASGTAVRLGLSRGGREARSEKNSGSSPLTLGGRRHFVHSSQSALFALSASLCAVTGPTQTARHASLPRHARISRSDRRAS
jgi:uncharacterized protein YbjQ (UPF0145 family)